MRNCHTSYELHGFKVEIECDEYAESPYNWGNDELFLGELESRNYRVGRKGWGKASAEAHIPFGEGPWDIENTDYYELALRTDDPVELKAHWDDVHDASWAVYPVRLRDYGSNGWRLEECGHDECDGYIFQKLPYSCDLEQLAMPDFDAEGRKDELLDAWNVYASGDVHVVTVLDTDGEIVESCGGVYGGKEAEDMAKDMVNGLRHQTKVVPMVVLYGSLPLPFPSRVEAEVTQITVPLYIGNEDAVRWALEEGPFKDHPDIISITLYDPRTHKEAAK